MTRRRLDISVFPANSGSDLGAPFLPSTPISLTNRLSFYTVRVRAARKRSDSAATYETDWFDINISLARTRKRGSKKIFKITVARRSIRVYRIRHKNATRGRNWYDVNPCARHARYKVSFFGYRSTSNLVCSLQRVRYDTGRTVEA